MLNKLCIEFPYHDKLILHRYLSDHIGNKNIREYKAEFNNDSKTGRVWVFINEYKNVIKIKALINNHKIYNLISLYQ